MIMRNVCEMAASTLKTKSLASTLTIATMYRTVSQGAHLIVRKPKKHSVFYLIVTTPIMSLSSISSCLVIDHEYSVSSNISVTVGPFTFPSCKITCPLLDYLLSLSSISYNMLEVSLHLLLIIGWVSCCFGTFLSQMSDSITHARLSLLTQSFLCLSPFQQELSS